MIDFVHYFLGAAPGSIFFFAKSAKERDAWVDIIDETLSKVSRNEKQ